MAGEKIGSGRRFRVLEAGLAKKAGVRSPAGLAAYIGRKKYGKGRMAQLAAAKRRGEKLAAEHGEPIARRRVRV